MSRRCNCWDSSCIESMFGHRKDELEIHIGRVSHLFDYTDMKETLKAWIVEYNTNYPHSTLGELSPIGSKKNIA